MRFRGKWIIPGLFILAAVFASPGVRSQEGTPVPVGLSGGDVDIQEVKPQLETMGLIWIQEGSVRRLAYVVQTGDTLWDIAERYLNSPYYWPKIWERNTFIINPHLIFPGDILYVYPEGVIERPYVEREEKIEVQPWEEAIEEEEKQEVVFKLAEAVGFVSLEELEASGKIVDNVRGKTILGKGDRVYVDVGKTDRVVKGDRYSIYRILENPKGPGYHKVKHPITGEVVGYQILNLGDLEIIEVGAKVSTALIRTSFKEIENGDLIRPYLDPLAARVKVKRAEVEMLHGYIIATRDRKTLVGEKDVVYIDAGSEDGVVRGNKFDIYKPCEIIEDGLQEDTIRVPEEIIGELVVLDPHSKTSVALITDSSEEATVGERVFTSKYSSWEIEGVSQPVEVDECRRDPTCRLITEQEYRQGMDNPYCERVEKRRRGEDRWSVQ